MRSAVAAALAAALCMSVGLAPLFIGTLPVFLPPVSRALAWGAAIYPQSALAAGVTSALTGPVIGYLIDRFGVRPVVMLGLLAWASSLFGLSTLNGSRMQLIGIGILIGMTGAACGPIALAKVVAGWFERHRALVLGFVLSAAPAISTALMVLVANALITSYGWRFSYRVFALGVLCLALPRDASIHAGGPGTVRPTQHGDRAGRPGRADG